jgi:ABC-type lipoprotein release transport system permease subunit
MALGAEDGRLIRLAMRRGLKQLAIGSVLGIALAALATRPLQIVLYEVNARDPVIFGGVVLLLVLVGVLASYIPARRVSQIHPAEALQAG